MYVWVVDPSNESGLEGGSEMGGGTDQLFIIYQKHAWTGMDAPEQRRVLLAGGGAQARGHGGWGGLGLWGLDWVGC